MHVLKFFLNTLLLIVVVAGGIFGFVHRKDLAHEASVLGSKVFNRLQEVSGTQYATAESAAALKPVASTPAPVASPATVVVASPPPATDASQPAARGAVGYPPDDYSPKPPLASAKPLSPEPDATPASVPAEQIARLPDSEAPSPAPYSSEGPVPAPYYAQPMPYQGYAPQMPDAGQPQVAAPTPELAPTTGVMPSQAGRPAEMTADTRSAWIEARRAFWSQDIAKAEEAYLKLIKENADEADLTGELGNLYLSQGRVDDAAEQYLETGRRLLKGTNRGRVGSLVAVLSRLDHAKAEQLRQEMRAQHGQQRLQGRRTY